MIAAHDTQALADIAAAKKILARLCDEGLVHMSIPVRSDDEDMVLSRVIALASRLQEQEGQPALSDEQISDAIPQTATILPGEPRKVCMTRTELHQFAATLAAGSQAVQVPGWRPTDDEIRQAWDDLQKREEAAAQALRAARIGSTCAACGVGKLAADGNGYNNFERCDSCSYVPFYDENGVDLIAKLAKARAATPLQPLAGGEGRHD